MKIKASDVKELQTRNEDLVEAMKVIGRIIIDGDMSPKDRLTRIAGILSLYECNPPKPPTGGA